MTALEYGYPRPYRRRPKAMQLAGPAAAVPFTIDGIEVVQCIQDLANSVPLLADKPTMVRIYPNDASVGRAGNLTAELAWSHDGGAESYLPALSTVKIDPAKPRGVADRRTSVDGSFNFRLPSGALGAGNLTLRLSRVFQPGGDGLSIGTPPPVTVALNAAAPLRIRVIGLRYDNGQTHVSPAAIHFDYLRSFLLRAYPIARIEWSQIVVDADFQAPLSEDTADLANAQIAAIRSREVSSGTDARTHYFGLVDDDGSRNFMRGKAFAIPGTPQPDVIASGPAGVPNGFAGDNDASYADWYGAHELGHTFGRYHPGFPPGQQDASDPQFPYADGCISTPDGRFNGFDLGDSQLGIPMAAVPGLTCHDIMTYAHNQWISPYTYQAILSRLTAEDSL